MKLFNIFETWNFLLAYEMKIMSRGKKEKTT